MKRPPLHQIVTSLAVALLALSPLPRAKAEAIPVVQWGGNYYTNDSDVDLNILDNYPAAETVALPNGVLLPYSETIGKSPVYPHYQGPSATFYGAVQLTTEDGSGKGKMQVRIQRHGDANRIHLNSLHASNANPANAQGLFFWKKDDFLAGFDGKPSLPLSDLSQLALSVPRAYAKTLAIRFAVQSNGVWYLSGASLTGTYFGTAPDQLVMDNPAGDQWAEWNPDTGTAPLNPPPLDYEVSGSTLNAITAVGFYFNATYQASNAAILDFDSFKVSAENQ